MSFLKCRLHFRYANGLEIFAVHLILLLAISASYKIVDWLLLALFEYNLFRTPWLDFPLKLVYGGISLSLGYRAIVYQQKTRLSVWHNTVLRKNQINLADKIQRLLNEKKVYRDPELTATSFSEMLGVHRNEISMYFTARETTFRSTINHYRIKHFLGLINEGKNQNLTILSLAFESGFNSKASFNRIFKATLGQKPKEYIKATESSILI